MLNFKELQFQFKEKAYTNVEILRPDIEKALTKMELAGRLSLHQWELVHILLSRDGISTLRRSQQGSFRAALKKLEVEHKPLPLHKVEKPYGPLEAVLADDKFMQFAYETGITQRDEDNVLKEIPELTAQYELTARQAQIWRAYEIGRLTTMPEVVLKVFGEYKRTHRQNIETHWFRSLASLKAQGFDLNIISIPSGKDVHIRGIGCSTVLSPQELRAAKAIFYADPAKGISNLDIGRIITDNLVDDNSARSNAATVLTRLEDQLPDGLGFDTRKNRNGEVYRRFIAI